MNIDLFYNSVMLLAAMIFILAAVLRAFGITIEKIKNFVLWFIGLFRFEVKDKKKQKRTQRKVKKYAKKHNLTEDEVYAMLREKQAINEREIEKKKIAKENAKRDKELNALIK